MLRTLLPSLLLLATLTEAAHYLVWLPMCSKYKWRMGITL